MGQPSCSSELRALVAALALFGAGCSSLPESAAPKGKLVEPSSLPAGDLIGYRTLTRADFMGEKAPPEFASVADRAGATTCARVVTPDIELEISGMEKANGSGHYKSKVKQPLIFRALMDRSCSWWNDKIASEQPAYVLEHEQIHFAIFELGARKLNASASDLARDMEGEGSSQEKLREHALEVHTQAMKGALESIMERSRDFDEDTSLGYKPARQKVWRERVSKELAETQSWAR